jgi:hypothetical protein
MLTMRFMLKNSFLVVAAFFCAGRLAYGQGVDTIVEIPTTAQRSAIVEIPTARQTIADDSGSGATMAGEYKSTKNVIEEQKPVCWNWYADVGYESEYNFRGTDLMPDSDGGVFGDVAVSKWGFTLGMFAIHQLGTARADSWSMGEGGGGGSGNFSQIFGGLVSFAPETIQDRFNEIDVFLQYHRSFGPIDVTVGDIGFFIDRRAQTFFDVSSPFFPTFRVGPIRTVQDEQFDRVFVRLATSIIPHIQPWITYYQTIYSDGQDPGIFAGGGFPAVHERNSSFGGYLEGRLRGTFPIGQWVDINPYGDISVSFHDRTEPVENPVKFHDFIRGKSLSGFNVAQAGLELPIHLFHVVGSSSGPCAPPDLHVDLVPGFTYSYHISTPTAGTDRNEVWGGVKLAVTF